MDVVSHALWGAMACGGPDQMLLAAAFGMAPDILAFGPHIISSAARGKINTVRETDMSRIPSAVVTMYNCTHSLIIYAGIFIFLKLFWGPRVAFASLAWLLHILFDIPTHAKQFFPTKFLFPLSEFCINGIPWSSKPVMIINFTGLAIVYSLFWAGILG